MALKRSASELEERPARSHRHRIKRTRLSPSAEKPNDSSSPSSGSVSEASALQSSPPASKHSRQSSLTLPESRSSSTISGHSTSEYATDSDDEHWDEDNESEVEDIITIGGARKPEMRLGEGSGLGEQSLRDRLRAFLPQMAEANEDLARDKDGLNIEEVDEEEEHIEMNLGLGVLEEKKEDESSSDESEEFSESEVSGEEEEDDEDVPRSSGAVKLVPEDRDTNVLDKLRGQRQRQEKPAIYHLDQTVRTPS